MTTPHAWQESYMAAVLETDWTRILLRIEEAESAIFERKRMLGLDHGGTPEERNAIVGALNGLKGVRRDVTEWSSREQSKNSAF
jgi:hypothetical protein